MFLSAALFAVAGVAVAQGPPGRDPYNAPPGHGGVPPGQAKKQGNGGMPPGQAKKYGGDWRFRGEDRDRFYSHYKNEAKYWRGRKRPVFVPGQAIPSGYYVRPVPQAYYQEVPPPPPGYQYGYYSGYVVAYNPATRVVADVVDLVGALTGH
jgi:hypothetical protein